MRARGAGPVVSPGSTSISRSSTTTAVTRKPDSRRMRGSRRSTPGSARSSRSSTASCSRRKSLRWSSSVGSSSSTYRFCSAGWRITWRPTPTVAAFGRVTSGGTSIRRSVTACALQASRHPSASSCGENARASTAEAGTSPASIRTRHFLHVPWPPQVESIAMPFQEAASKTVTPGGTRTAVPDGSKLSATRAGPSAARRLSTWSSRSVTPARPPPGPAGGRRSSSCPTRRARTAGRPPGMRRPSACSARP